MIKNTLYCFLFVSLLTTSCISFPNITVRKYPTEDFSLQEKSVTVAVFPSRNFSDHYKLDLARLNGKLLSKARDTFENTRFVPINKLKENILSGQDKQVVEDVIGKFEKSGMLSQNAVIEANQILKAEYFLAPSFGANIGAGYSSDWILTLSVQIYDGNTGKAVFSVTAEETIENTDGFEPQESDLFDALFDRTIKEIP